MKFESPRFGQVEAESKDLIVFKHGLPGFPDCLRFIIMEHDRETPIKWLQCVDRPEVAFLIVEPEQFMQSYELEVEPQVLEIIEWESSGDSGDVAIFVLLNVEEEQLTANLRAPVVVNIPKRKAVQMILDDPKIPLRHPIGPKSLENDPPSQRTGTME